MLLGSSSVIPQFSHDLIFCNSCLDINGIGSGLYVVKTTTYMLVKKLDGGDFIKGTEGLHVS
jgi:hypothetical protein